MLTECDTRVRNASTVKSKKVWIVRDDDSCFGQGKRDVVFVRRSSQSSLDSGCHVDFPTPETIGDGGVDVLIQMKTKHHRPQRRRAFESVETDWSV